jgi:hypothetical protein
MLLVRLIHVVRGAILENDMQADVKTLVVDVPVQVVNPVARRKEVDSGYILQIVMASVDEFLLLLCGIID